MKSLLLLLQRPASMTAAAAARYSAARRFTTTSSSSSSSAASSKVIFNVTSEDFEQVVVESPVPVILDCWAAWCGPCRQLAPVLERLITEQKGKVRLAKLDTDANPELSRQLQIKSLPTLLTVHEGKLVGLEEGFGGEAKVKKLVEAAAALNK